LSIGEKATADSRPLIVFLRIQMRECGEILTEIWLEQTLIAVAYVSAAIRFCSFPRGFNAGVVLNDDWFSEIRFDRSYFT
jgi:hypothetical protein